MKKIIGLGIVAALLLAVPLAQTAMAKSDTSMTKVAICHFGGHNGDAVITGKGCGCLYQGGSILIVASVACEKGHKASGDCLSDNIGGLDPDTCS